MTKAERMFNTIVKFTLAVLVGWALGYAHCYLAIIG